MAWADLEAEIAETFSILQVPSYAGFSSFARSERITAKQRERRAYFRKRWAALKAAPLVPVEIDGVIWMRPPAELERHRERARRRARERREGT
jgi:hypothetical protein